MNRDRRPAKEQIKSGFQIAGKMVAAFLIAAIFFSGCGLAHEGGELSLLLGWLLIVSSIALMGITVRYWAAGFVAFVAYAALRLLVGTLFARSLHVSPLLMLGLAASLFIMGLLSIRFSSRKPRITQLDRASLVIAAVCGLLSLPLMDSYRGVTVLNVGNVALLLAWLAAQSSRHAPQSISKTAAHQ